MIDPPSATQWLPWALSGNEQPRRPPITSHTDIITDGAGRPPTGNRIAVIGTFGNANLGDDSLLEAFLRWVRGNAPATEVIALTPRPDQVARTFGLTAFDHDGRQSQSGGPFGEPTTLRRQSTPAATAPRDKLSGIKTRLKAALPGLWSAIHMARRFMATSTRAVTCFPRQLRVARSLDGLIVLGGGQIYDHWGGSSGHPMTLFLWSLACRISSVPVVVLSAGGRPLRYRASAWLWRQVLLAADYVSFRDPDTVLLARDLGFLKHASPVPDLAFGLDVANEQVGTTPRIVGVSPMAYVMPGIDPEADELLYCRYVGVLAAFCERLHESGYQIAMFPSQTRSDRIAIDDLLSRLAPATRRDVVVREVDGVDALLRCIAETDAMVATRFHGVLLSLVSGRPVVSISYQPRKNDRLLEPFGLAHLALAVDTLEAEGLWQAFRQLVAHYPAHCNAIAAGLPKLRNEVNNQYRRVFAERGWFTKTSEPTGET